MPATIFWFSRIGLIRPFLFLICFLNSDNFADNISGPSEPIYGSLFNSSDVPYHTTPNFRGSRKTISRPSSRTTRTCTDLSLISNFSLSPAEALSRNRRKKGDAFGERRRLSWAKTGLTSNLPDIRKCQPKTFGGLPPRSNNSAFPTLRIPKIFRLAMSEFISFADFVIRKPLGQSLQKPLILAPTSFCLINFLLVISTSGNSGMFGLYWKNREKYSIVS